MSSSKEGPKDTFTRLFDVSNQLEFANENDFQKAWCVSDNIWHQRGGKKYSKKHNADVEVYCCRLHTTEGAKRKKVPYTSKDIPVDSQRPNTSFRPSIMCEAKLKVSRSKADGSVTVIPFGKGNNSHCHEIEDSDAKKRCKYLLEGFERDLDRGFLPSDIQRGVVAEFHTSGANIGAKFFKRMDVVNRSTAQHKAIPPESAIKADLAAAEDWIKENRADYTITKLSNGFLMTNQKGMSLIYYNISYFYCHFFQSSTQLLATLLS